VHRLIVGLLGLTALIPRLILAQADRVGSTSVAGEWIACVGVDSAKESRIVCGQVSLTNIEACNWSHGTYTIDFANFQSLPHPPRDSASFVWTIASKGLLHLDNGAYLNPNKPADVIASCRVGDGSDFYADLEVHGDSAIGRWGQYGHYAGQTVLGTIKMARSQPAP